MVPLKDFDVSFRYVGETRGARERSERGDKTTTVQQRQGKDRQKEAREVKERGGEGRGEGREGRGEGRGERRRREGRDHNTKINRNR